MNKGDKCLLLPVTTQTDKTLNPFTFPAIYISYVCLHSLQEQVTIVFDKYYKLYIMSKIKYSLYIIKIFRNSIFTKKNTFS